MYINTEINNARQRELAPINYKKKEKYGFKKSQKQQQYIRNSKLEFQ